MPNNSTATYVRHLKMRFNAQHLHSENACIAKISITTCNYCIKARSCKLTDNGKRDSYGSGRQAGIYLFAATADFDKQVLWQRSAWVFGCTWANSRWVISGFMHGGKKSCHLRYKEAGWGLIRHLLVPSHTYSRKIAHACAETSLLGGGGDLIPLRKINTFF